MLDVKNIYILSVSPSAETLYFRWNKKAAGNGSSQLLLVSV